MSNQVPWQIEQQHGTEAIRIRDDKGEIRGEFATLKDLAAHTAFLMQELKHQSNQPVAFQERGRFMNIDRHGHVVPLPGGIKARCGGPSLCKDCQREQAYEDGRKVAHRLTRDWSYDNAVPMDAALEAITKAYMQGKGVA